MAEQTTTTTYLMNFIIDLKQLTDNFCAYNNYLLYLKNKINTQAITPEYVNTLINEKRIEPEELKALEQIANNIRYWATQTYLKQMGFSKKIQAIKDSHAALETLYREIQRTTIPEFETVEKYCILNHELFATTALNEIILKTPEYYDTVSGINES